LIITDTKNFNIYKYIILKNVKLCCRRIKTQPVKVYLISKADTSEVQEGIFMPGNLVLFVKRYNIFLKYLFLNIKLIHYTDTFPRKLDLTWIFILKDEKRQ